MTSRARRLITVKDFSEFTRFRVINTICTAESPVRIAIRHWGFFYRSSDLSENNIIWIHDTQSSFGFFHRRKYVFTGAHEARDQSQSLACIWKFHLAWNVFPWCGRETSFFCPHLFPHETFANTFLRAAARKYMLLCHLQICTLSSMYAHVYECMVVCYMWDFIWNWRR